MNEFLVSLRELQRQWGGRWAALDARERRLMLVAGALTLVVLVFFMGVRPAWRTLARTPAELRELDAQINGMHRLAEETAQLRTRPTPAPMEAQLALKSATDRLGESAHLAVQGDRATLTLNAVSGDALSTWLEEARMGAKARPVEASLQQVSTGHYNGSIVLALPAGDADH